MDVLANGAAVFHASFTWLWICWQILDTLFISPCCHSLKSVFAYLTRELLGYFLTHNFATGARIITQLFHLYSISCNDPLD